MHKTNKRTVARDLTRLLKPRVDEHYFANTRALGHTVSAAAVVATAHTAAQFMYNLVYQCVDQQLAAERALRDGVDSDDDNDAAAAATENPSCINIGTHTVQQVLDNNPDVAGVVGLRARVNTLRIGSYVPAALFAQCIERNPKYNSQRSLTGRFKRRRSEIDKDNEEASALKDENNNKKKAAAPASKKNPKVGKEQSDSDASDESSDA